MRGAFGSAGVNGVAAPLKAVRVDAFDESGDGATAAELMSIELFIHAKSLMGELADDLMDGALWLHPTILAALAIERGLILQTTDADFARFPGLKWKNPLA